MIDISLKNTKQEILDAYEMLLKSHKQAGENRLSLQIDEPRDAKKSREIPTKSTIFDRLDTLRTDFLSELDEVSTTLREKYSLVDLLDEEVREKEKYMKEILKISTEAESLFALIDLQNQQKKAFSEELEQKNRLRKTEEEDWKYAFEQKKKTETYEYETKRVEMKRKWDEEIKEKTESLSKKEKEFLDRAEYSKSIERENTLLKSQLSEIALTLEKDITERLQKEFTQRQILIEKDYELSQKLSTQEVKNLEEKLEELRSQNKKYELGHAEMTKRLENVVSKVVEGNRPVVYAGWVKGE